MRKICLLMLLALFVGFSASAQIQRKFFDFQLASTTKNEVVDYFKELGKPVKFLDEYDGIQVENLRFGGAQWPSVIFKFYKNRLFVVSFINSEEDVSKTKLDDIIEGLTTKLYNKYSSYFDPTSSNNEYTIFSDDSTEICLRQAYFSGIYMFLMMYTDSNIMQAIAKEEIDEL